MLGRGRKSRDEKINIRVDQKTILNRETTKEMALLNPKNILLEMTTKSTKMEV